MTATARESDTRKAYPLREAAALLGISARTIKRRADAGEFTLGRLGRQRMVPAAWVDQYSAWPPEGGEVA